MAPAVVSEVPAPASLVKKPLAEPSANGTPVDADAGDRRLVKKPLAEPSPVAAVAGDRRLARDFTVPSFFSQDMLDRFGAPTNLGGLLPLMGDGFSSMVVSAPGRGWSVAKEDDEAVYLKVSMPGMGKEHVKVSAEQNSVVIKAEGEKDPWDGDKAVPTYSRRIELSANAFKMDKIKGEMKNGVLRVTVPKLKKEERKDVFQVQIE